MTDQAQTTEQPDYKDILLRLIGSLTLCDHMGDVASDVKKALTMAGVKIDEWDDLDDLGGKLGKMGVTTLFGTELSSDEDDE